jgi:phosphatidylserine/phosphatidylglycerophosphate/cardiolipin synthase-like enzyme
MSEMTYELPLEKDFLQTLIEYLTHKGETELITLLKHSSMSFKTTSTFTEKIWNTYWCSIVFSIQVSELQNVNKKTLVSLEKYCSEILPTTSGFLIKEINFIPQITPKQKEVEVEVVFEEQKNKILSEISKAKFTIWIAVAWFTLDEIYDLLVIKQNEGVDVRIIMSKDEINKPKYEKYKDKLNIMAYPKFGSYNDNLMHNKFCVIDIQKVVHGSYNWSKKAEYNKETVEIVDDKKTAEKFSEQFKNLYMDIKKIA